MYFISSIIQQSRSIINSLISRKLWAYIIFVLGLTCFLSEAFASVALLEVIGSEKQYEKGGRYPVLFRVSISPPWYIHGPDSNGDALIPTRIFFDKLRGIRVVDVRFPEPDKKKFQYTEEPAAVYSGELEISATLVLENDLSPGRYLVKGSFSYQACSSDSCLAPEKIPIVFPVSITTGEGTPSSPGKSVQITEGEGLSSSKLDSGQGLLLTLFGFFLAGLALNLTPCIYPLIPITVSYFGGRSRNIQGRTLVHGLLYISGLAFTNSVLGVTASLSGNMLGSALQSPAVLLAVAAILVILALSFFGLWEIRVPVVLNRLASRNMAGYPGSFFMGLTLGVVAAPCVGPLILGLLTYVAQKGDPFFGFICFFTLSIGLGLPLLVLALFSTALKNLPMSGEWMVWIRKALGWVLIFMAGNFLRPLAGGRFGEALLMGGMLIVAAVHLGWLEKSGRDLRFLLYVKKILGIGLIIGAGIVFWNVNSTGDGISWISYDRKLLAQAAEKELPVIIDFYADWCGPCKVMDERVFSDPEIVELSSQFVPLKVDLTTRHPLQGELLKQYQIKGVPTVIFINEQGIEEKALRVEALVSRDQMLKRIKQLIKLPSKSN